MVGAARPRRWAACGAQPTQRRGRPTGARRGAAALGVAVLAAGAALEAATAFVSAASLAVRERRAAVQAAASPDPERAKYDWQRVAENAAGAQQQGTDDVGLLDPDALPDLPDFEDEEVVPVGGVQTNSLGASVKVREVSLPDLPGDDELLPPEPSPISDGGLGFFEWTGLWIGGLFILGALGTAGSYALARANLDPEFAESLLLGSKFFLTLFQGLFLLRIILTQFPRIKTAEGPWAPVHYSTEWVLSPLRKVVPPEAGVDVAPIICLTIVLLASELLTGPAGILQLVKSKAPMPAGLR